MMQHAPEDGVDGSVHPRSVLRRIVAAGALATGVWIGLAVVGGSDAFADTPSTTSDGRSAGPAAGNLLEGVAVHGLPSVGEVVGKAHDTAATVADKAVTPVAELVAPAVTAVTDKAVTPPAKAAAPIVTPVTDKAVTPVVKAAAPVVKAAAPAVKATTPVVKATTTVIRATTAVVTPVAKTVVDVAKPATDKVVAPVVRDVAAPVIRVVVAPVRTVTAPITKPIAAQVVEPIGAAAKPVIAAAKPIVAAAKPIVTAAEPIVRPVTDLAKDVAGSLVTPIVVATAPAVAPIVEVVDEVTSPVVEILVPVTAVLDPITSPAVDIPVGNLPVVKIPVGNTPVVDVPVPALGSDAAVIDPAAHRSAPGDTATAAPSQAPTAGLPVAAAAQHLETTASAGVLLNAGRATVPVAARPAASVIDIASLNQSDPAPRASASMPDVRAAAVASFAPSAPNAPPAPTTPQGSLSCNGFGSAGGQRGGAGDQTSATVGESAAPTSLVVRVGVSRSDPGHPRSIADDRTFSPD